MQRETEQSDEGLFEDMTPEQQQQMMQEQFNIADEDLEGPTNTESADPLRAENALTVMGADRPSNPNIAHEGSFAFNTPASGGTVPLPSPETQAQTTQANTVMQNTTPPPQGGQTDAAAHDSRHTHLTFMEHKQKDPAGKHRLHCTCRCQAYLHLGPLISKAGWCAHLSL